ncbi:MAG: hypothetical protein IJ538_00985 [Clostridia bacterium]|nr:hypothetical protein [Clostridia bacterium]
MITLEQANEYTKRLFSTSWVQWIHEGSEPAETHFQKSVNVFWGTISSHCAN